MINYINIDYVYIYILIEWTCAAKTLMKPLQSRTGQQLLNCSFTNPAHDNAAP
jgi:hypothetical protein